MEPVALLYIRSNIHGTGGVYGTRRYTTTAETSYISVKKTKPDLLSRRGSGEKLHRSLPYPLSC